MPTDSAIDPLPWHKMIRDSNWKGRVVPAYRPDAVVDPEFARDQLGLVEPVAAPATDIELLQRDDVGRNGCDDLCDARWRDDPVTAFAGVNVVGHHSQAFEGFGAVSGHPTGNAPH